MSGEGDSVATSESETGEGGASGSPAHSSSTQSPATSSPSKTVDGSKGMSIPTSGLVYYIYD